VTRPALWAAAAALIGVVAGGAPAQQQAAARPNVLLIMTDDQGWPELGVHGNPVIETPNLDRLAGEGVRLSRFYCSPVCTPTRAALLTGRYPQRSGAIDTYMGRDTMAADEVTVAEVLRGVGYRTGQFGKWHLGRYARYHPQSRGFDDYFGFWQYGFINRYFDSPELFEGRTPVITTGYVTDVLTDRALRFIEENRARPFFCYVPYNAPHAPNLAPDALVAKYLRKGLSLSDAQIYGMIDSVDQNVGRLLAALDRLALRDNTLVLFLTDNGFVSRHYTAGLRGRKGTVFEGGIRVPFLARWPGRIPAGKVVDVPAQHIDVLPTLCEAAGAPLPAGRKLDGVSILGLLRNAGGPAPHRYLFHQWTRVRPSSETNWAVHEGNWKLAEGKLYDLARDPGEEKDLAGEEPERAQTMRRAFLDWFAEVTAGQEYQRVPIEIGREDEDPVEIDLAWADPVGGVVPRYVHYNRDHTENWSRPGDALTWKVEVTRAGRYELRAAYGCLPADAGGAFRVTCGPARLESRTEAGGGPAVYVRRVLGVLDLTPGKHQLRMEATAVPGRVLMELHKLHLKRLP
jgi:arylsulfatase A-like enzyme